MVNCFSGFRSCLRDRNQRVVIDGYSPWCHITSGVPQGFILGPFLFLLFINYLPASVYNGKPLIFADDTKLSSNVKSPNNCQNLHDDIDNLFNWSVSGILHLTLLNVKS